VYQQLEQNRANLADMCAKLQSKKKGSVKAVQTSQSFKFKTFQFEKKLVKYTMPLCHFDSYNLWILKPTNLNRGRGIHVFRDLETLRKLIKQYCVGLDTEKRKLKFNTFIIQKYIEKPLLINNRKFDIRVWVCLT
jgi:hypothetical protein